MKNKIKYCLNASFVFFLLIAFQVVQGQAPVVTINYNSTGLVPGSTITVPLTITGTEVGNLSFLISYDRDVLTYVSAVNTVAGYGLAGVNNNYLYLGQTYLKASLGYSTSLGPPTGATYANQAVFTFTFTFNGGSTNFSFFNVASATSQTANQYTYVKALPYTTINLATSFNNGSASGDYGVLHSKPVGGDWNTAATWIENKVPSSVYDVFITANDVSINPSTNIAKVHNLTVNTGGKLTLNSGKTLTVGGAFTIESGGSFIDKNSTSTLAATVKRTMTGNYAGSGNPTPSTIWHYVSAPTTNATIGTFLGCLLNKWTENAAGGYWDTLYLPLTLPLEIGRGYSLAATAGFGDAIFSGTLNTGNITRSGLTNSNPSPGTGNGYYGYHLLGNPFASAFKYDAFVSLANMDAAIYLWNGSTYISKLPADNYEVQAQQAFFMHANTSGGSVVIPNGNRIHSNGSYLKSTVSDNLTLTVTGNGLEDETSIRFNELSTAGFDGDHDAYKLFGVYNCPQIFSILSEINLSINSLPDLSSQGVVPIGFKSGVSGNYTINASGLESFAAGTNFYLTDLFTGSVQNLNSNPIYSFSASPANTEHRFNLQFSPVGLDKVTNSSSIKIYSSNKSIFVNIAGDLKGGDIVVYDMLGREITRKAVEENILNKLDVNAAEGYYLVKVVTNTTSVSEKVFIR